MAIRCEMRGLEHSIEIVSGLVTADIFVAVKGVFSLMNVWFYNLASTAVCIVRSDFSAIEKLLLTFNQVSNSNLQQQYGLGYCTLFLSSRLVCAATWKEVIGIDVSPRT